MLGGNLLPRDHNIFPGPTPWDRRYSRDTLCPYARGYPTTGHAGTPRDRLTGRLGILPQNRGHLHR